MSAAATTRISPRSPWTSHSQMRPPSTTPLAPPAISGSSVGQAMPPFLSSTARPSHLTPDCRTPSPNYFGFFSDPASNPTDSNPAYQQKTSRSPPSSGVRPTIAPSSKVHPLDSSSRYDAFRRQSETKTFVLGHGSLSQFSMNSPPAQKSTASRTAGTEDLDRGRGSDMTPRSIPATGIQRQKDGEDRMELDSGHYFTRPSQMSLSPGPSGFDIPRQESPGSLPFTSTPQHLSLQLSHADERHSRLSLPYNKAEPPLSPTSPRDRAQQRADTLPPRLQSDGPLMVAPQDIAHLLKSSPQSVLLLDLRVSPQYTQSRITGALNLCIPTTLLKRPSYNVQRLVDTFTIESERSKFSRWKEIQFIVVYDGSSSLLRDATSSLNTLKKFTNEGWKGNAYVVRGGFAEFSSDFPDMIDQRPSGDTASTCKKTLSLESAKAGPAAVVGGCPMPNAKTAGNAFFGNIRQNMDLIGGVGQMPIKRPSPLTEESEIKLPKWILRASNAKDGGKMVSDRFLTIEKAEQRRLQIALTGNVSYGSPGPNTPKSVQIAGIEKGSKNRYNNIWPYDHSRVRLQGVASGDCDYINASHVKAAWTNKHYIATQAPIPATFEDFWRVVWEQDVRMILMLTAETEGGQLKGHPYWKSADYGLLKVEALSEKRVLLPYSRDSPKLSKSHDRPSMGRRRSTNPTTTADDTHKDVKTPPAADPPHVIIRKLALSHAGHPFAPLREITQLQYSCWPDFGVPADPTHVLGLIEQCNDIVGTYSHRPDSSEPEPPGQRPVVVHCSAGCGRTGTFCTVDSVLDMFKRQKRRRSRASQQQQQGGMEVDEVEAWLDRDDIDLVAKTVEDLRGQRLSMVQSLRQFVLCYETVLEWLVRQETGRGNAEGGGGECEGGVMRG